LEIREVWASLPPSLVEQGRQEGAHIDYSLKSPWQVFVALEPTATFDRHTAEATETPQIVGFIGLLLVGQTKAHIRGWYVFPNHRGLGLGTRLLEEAMHWAAANGYATLEIRTTHDVEWAGFVPTGYRRVGGNRETQFVAEFVL
jgi:GNAT superfamily N-acetyltransferase